MSKGTEAEAARENLYAASLAGASEARLSVLRARVRQAEREDAEFQLDNMAEYRVRFRYPPKREIHNTLIVKATSEAQARKLANAILKEPQWTFGGGKPRIAWID